ncbi:IS1182 family transposase [Pseudogracilibacillus sp. ICA-222130]|uniref:IS1182 family transposase n=1 Tax=Pseudogracilibacillus sp. ICA-222130 TaxID=3134655 RepID=UPI0030BAE7CF
MFKHYTMNQVILPLDLEIKLPKNDIAFTVHELVESIPEEAFGQYARQTGCPAYHPKMMMKIILCAYTQSVFSGRKIEALVKDSIRMMWLAQGYEPSYRSINRFRSNEHTEELLRQCFVQFRCTLIEEKEIDAEAIFIDGTKVEANANKFTFVWRRSTERYSANLVEKSNRAYEELLEKEIVPAIERENPEELSADELETIVEKLDETIDAYTKRMEASDVDKRKALRSERKEPKKHRKQFNDWLTRKQKYAKDMEIFAERNSYSKTDYDATFMRMKDDYMRNGQLKAGYNLQVATEGQYALAYDIYPNPTDTRTLIPFLDTIEEKYFTLPTYVVADTGYGSEQNYDDIINNRHRVPLITYGQYRKEKKKKYKEDPFNPANWSYDKTNDRYTCLNGQLMPYQYDTYRTDRYGFRRNFKVYESVSCDGCPLRDLCTKAKEGNNRKLFYNKKWETHKTYIREKLSNEETGEIYGKRKIDVEPFFGFLKANLGLTRMSVRGKSQVHNEIGFALMAVNLRKFTAINKEKHNNFHLKTRKSGVVYKKHVNHTTFIYLRLVMSQPLSLISLFNCLGVGTCDC